MAGMAGLSQGRLFLKKSNDATIITHTVVQRHIDFFEFLKNNRLRKIKTFSTNQFQVSKSESNNKKLILINTFITWRLPRLQLCLDTFICIYN